MPSEKTFSSTHRAYILNIGWMEDGESFKLTASDSDKMSVSIFRLNEDRLTEAFDILSSEPFVVDHYTSTTVSGHITTAGGLMYTSIPYEKGWKVYVDGVLTSPMTFADTMLAIPLSAGDHSIDLTYSPDGLRDGALISIVAVGCFSLLALFSFMLYLSDRRKAKKTASTEVETPKTDSPPTADIIESEADSPDTVAEAVNTEPEAVSENDSLIPDEIQQEITDTTEKDTQND